MVTLEAMLGHNLRRQVQMLAPPSNLYSRAQRPAAWTFLRHRFIQRAGLLTEPKGELTLTLSSNPKAKKNLLHGLEALKQAA